MWQSLWRWGPRPIRRIIFSWIPFLNLFVALLTFARDASRQGLVKTNVLGAEIAVSTEIQNPTFVQKLMASPRNTTNIILFAIFGIISLALFLYVVIKMRGHHRDLITNGLIVLALIGAITAVNYYWSYGNMTTTQSLDYQNTR